MERYDVFLTPEAEAKLPKEGLEVGLWRLRGLRATPTKHPLKMYGIRSVGPIRIGKGMVVPERLAAYEAPPLPSMSCFALCWLRGRHLCVLPCAAC